MSENPTSSRTPLCDCSNEQKVPQIKKSKYSDDFCVIRNDEEPLSKLWDERRYQPELCDFTLIVGDRHLHAHKDVLMANIPYFKAMFESGMKETKSNQIEIKEIGFECLEMIIDYIYGQEIKLSAEFFLGLVLAADFYQLPKLVKRCMKAFPRLFTKDFDVNHLLPVHSFCRLVDEKKHIGPIEDAIMDNFETVSMHPEFPNLPFETILKFAESDMLTVKDEEVVLQAICRWLKGNPDRDSWDVRNLLECVRLPLLNISTLELLPYSDQLKHNRIFQIWVKDAIHMKQDKRFMGVFKSGAGEPIGTTIILPLTVKSKLTNDVLLYSICDGFWMKNKLFPEAKVVFISGEQICYYDSRNNLFFYHSFTTSLLKIHEKDTNCSPARFDRNQENDPKAMYNGKSWIFGNVHKSTLTLWKEDSTHCTRIEGIKKSTVLVYLEDAVYIIGGVSEAPARRVLRDVLMVKDAEISVKEQVQPVQIASMIVPRRSLSAVALKGKIYVCAGISYNGYSATCEVYDPQTNEWMLFPYPNSWGKDVTALSATQSNLYAISCVKLRNDRWTPQFEIFDEFEEKWVARKAISQEDDKKDKKKM